MSSTAITTGAAGRKIATVTTLTDRALQAMVSHAHNIAHTKDSEVDDEERAHSVDVVRYFDIAKAQGYSRYSSMEWEGNGEPFSGTTKRIHEGLNYLQPPRSVD